MAAFNYHAVTPAGKRIRGREDSRSANALASSLSTRGLIVLRLLGVADDSEPEVVKEEIPFLVGQAVAITEGPFTDFNGTVEEVLPDKGKVRVSVSLFGRPTSVELDYLQLKGY